MTWLRKGLRPAVARTAGHFLLLTGILTGTALPALALPMFEATDLGLLPGGGGDSYAYDINERGQVVGFSSTSMTDYHGRAFLWDPVMGMEDLGDLSGGNYSYAYGINNKGQVVGTSFSASHALLWQADGQMVDLGALIDPTGGKSSAAAINDRGQVVGTAAITGGGYLWDPVAGVTPLGFTPTSINSTGEVGGYIQDSSAVRQAVLWDAVNGLRVLDPSRGYVSDLNDSGEAAGIGGTGEDPYFLWGADGKGIPVEPILPGRVMEGWSLNNKGQVVGSGYVDSEFERALYWDAASGMLNLNDLLVNGENWSLFYATAINDKGEIVGYGGSPNHIYTAFLLTPVGGAGEIPEPPMLLLFAAGLTGIFLWKRGRDEARLTHKSFRRRKNYERAASEFVPLIFGCRPSTSV